MNKTEVFFRDYCRNNGYYNANQRDKVVSLFLKTEKHVSAFQLYEKLKKKGERIGYSTVYRTLKLLTEAGLADTLNYADEKHFEHKFAHKHHDHFICDKCGKTIEFSSETIERMQTKLAKKYKFFAKQHNLIIYGLCSKCRNKK
jgi:Fur family ferric uptake transcriptional regulator